MKAKNFLFVLVLSSLLIISCDKKQKAEFTAESEDMVFDSTSSVNGVRDPNKKFIHTADINIEVKDALRSTLTIEKNVAKLGGYVGKSELKSNIISKKITPISKDSARETKVYSVTNFMEVRIPKFNLNEFLLSLNQEIGFVTSRNLEITDVTTEAKITDMKSNSQKKFKNNSEYLEKADEKNEILQENNLVKNDELNDRIKYSTVTLALVEKGSIKQSIIANTINYTAYENSNFVYQLQTALYTGSHALQIVISALLYLWPLWVLLIIGYIVYKKYKTKK